MDETFVYFVPNGGTRTYDRIGVKQVLYQSLFPLMHVILSFSSMSYIPIYFKV